MTQETSASQSIKQNIEIEATTQKKKAEPFHNKLKLVYGPESYIHVERRESEKIITIAKYLSNKNDWIPLVKMCKDLKIPKNTLISVITRIAGVKQIEINKDGKMVMLCGRLIDVRKEMFNHKLNHPKSPAYLKAPFYIRRAHS